MSNSPASADARKRQLREFAEQQARHAQFDALWNELLDAAPDDVEVFLYGAAGLETLGMMEKAGKLLADLGLRLQEQKSWKPSLVALRKVAEIAPKERALRHGLVTAFKNLYAEDPRLPIYLRQSKLEAEADLKSALVRIETYFAFEPGRYLWHPQGWGAGRVADIDAEQTIVVIDFEKKRGHRLGMEMARTITEFIDAMDVRALKFDRMESLKAMIEGDPVELLRAALRSRRNKANLREIRDRLTDGVIPVAEWSKWWARARTKLKSVNDVKIAPGANPVVELAQGAQGYAQNCLRDVRLIEQDGKKLKYFRDLLKEAAEHPDGAEAVKLVAENLLGRDEARGMSLGPKISLAFLLLEAKETYPLTPTPASLRPEAVCVDAAAVMDALPAVPVGAHRSSALKVLRARGDQDWQELYRKVVLRGEPETAEECFAALVRDGSADVVSKVVREVVERFRDNPLSFAWFARAQLNDELPASVPKPSLPQLFEKLLLLHTYIEHRLFKADDAELRRLSKSLANLFIAKSCRVVREAFARENASEAEARNLDKVVRNCRSMPNDVRDKVLAAMLRTRPELGRREEAPEAGGLAAAGVDPNVIYVTDVGVTRRRTEYERLVNVLIPENAAEIGRAASYGDLSENAEWSAAIEKQTQLTRKSEEMVAELNRVRIIERSMQDGEHVTLGSKVGLRAEDGRRLDLVLLGPFEADNEKGILSYLSPLGTALLGKKVGEEFEFELPSGVAKYKVESLADGLDLAQ
jgi:transcription elongation GreA/GreB family factor